MKYYIKLDKDRYVMSIVHTGTKADFLELDLSKYDLSGSRVHAYKLEGKELVFDQNRYDELINRKQRSKDQKEIKELKQKLTESDYLVSRTFEQVMELTNPLTWIADVIKITNEFNKKYKETIANRKMWRKRIEELEKK